MANFGFDVVAQLTRLAGMGDGLADKILYPADEIRLIKASGLFDEIWYRKTYGELHDVGDDVVEHYVAIGHLIGLKPHPLFEAAYYRSQAGNFGQELSPLAHFLRTGRNSMLSPHPLFDAVWYAKSNPDLGLRNGVAAFYHFVRRGGPDGLDPNPLFDTAFYAAQHEGLRKGRVNALTHFVTLGARLGHDPHPLFALGWYAERNGLDVGAQALEHYLLVGAAEGRDPHPLFSSAWYCRQAEGRIDNLDNPLLDFLQQGAAQGLDPHPLFDVDWYAARNGLGRRQNPLVHFIQVGAAMGLDPHPLFSVNWWRSQVAPSAAGNTNPVAEYLEQRLHVDPHPCFDAEWYRATYSQAHDYGFDPLSHYLTEGARAGFYPNPYFDPTWYERNVPEKPAWGTNPLVHYLTRAEQLNLWPARFFDPKWYASQQAGSSDHIGGPFGHFVQMRKHRNVQGCNLASHNWPSTIDVPDVYNSGENTLRRYLASIGVTLHTSLAADAAKGEPAVYGRLLDRLVESARDWSIASVKGDGDPVVSVIIPVYNGLHLTLAALESIARCPSRVKFEVIVADNQSEDDTGLHLSGRADIRYILNPENIGFLRSCNRAASMARGQYIFLLNNDTMVCPGWLDELVDTFDEFDNVGLVGSRLLFPDGSLQEAGGILWRGGNAWNYGRNQDPGAPEFSYLRHVDYVSGCAIMTPKSVWDELGGFDELFVPSYCEDSDLALRIRAKGLGVLYQPMSTVIHFEGMTQGRDESKGVKAYQATNSVKLRERWADYFETLQEDGQELHRAKDRGVPRRVLYVDNCTPTPDEDSGSITSTNLMLMLRDSGFTVTFIPQDNFLYMPRYTKALQRRGVEVIYGYNTVEQHLKEYGARYDLVFLFRPQSWERCIDSIKEYAPKAKVIYHTCDLHFLRMQRQARVSNDLSLFASAAQMERLEFDAMTRSDLSILHSTAEQVLIRDLLPKIRTEVFGWAIPVEGSDKGFENRKDFVFLGGYQHTPNVDAVLHFVEDILPHVVKVLPDVVFRVVGSKAPPQLLRLAGPNIEIVGFVEDLKPVLDGARLAIAPLRFGAGMKGKLATTLAAGLPNVVTSIAAEGMKLIDGEHVLIADEPEAFAAAIVKVYQDRELWESLSVAGTKFAENDYGGTSARRTFINILDCVGLAPRGLVPAPRLVRPTHNSTCKARQPGRLAPIGVCRSLDDYIEFLQSKPAHAAHLYERQLARAFAGRSHTSVPGYCAPIDRYMIFNLQIPPGDADVDTARNFREDIVCTETGLNNRERLLATLLKQSVDAKAAHHPAILLMEQQVSRLQLWASYGLQECKLIAPPMFGPSYGAGEIDIICGNDFLEHAPSPKVALQECARLLRPGGHMITTTSFNVQIRRNTSRAVLEAGKIRQHLPPIYHGSGYPSPIFTDFGWELLQLARDAGFSDVSMEIYHAPEYAHLGGELFAFQFVH